MAKKTCFQCFYYLDAGSGACAANHTLMGGGYKNRHIAESCPDYDNSYVPIEEGPSYWELKGNLRDRKEEGIPLPLIEGISINGDRFYHVEYTVHEIVRGSNSLVSGMILDFYGVVKRAKVVDTCELLDSLYKDVGKVTFSNKHYLGAFCLGMVVLTGYPVPHIGKVIKRRVEQLKSDGKL